MEAFQMQIEIIYMICDQRLYSAVHTPVSHFSVLELSMPHESHRQIDDCSTKL